MIYRYYDRVPCCQLDSWWLHLIETFSELLALCEVNPPVTGGFLSQKPVMRSFGVFVDLRLNKRMSKQSKRRWFEMPLRSVWRHCTVLCAFNNNTYKTKTKKETSGKITRQFVPQTQFGICSQWELSAAEWCLIYPLAQWNNLLTLQWEC